MSKYKNNEDILAIMSNLQPHCCLKVDLQEVDQHAGGKRLIHDTKRHKDNQLQSFMRVKAMAEKKSWIQTVIQIVPHITCPFNPNKFLTIRWW